jgi:hypothetical protein
MMSTIPLRQSRRGYLARTGLAVIVVSDTSVLTKLAAIGQFDLLHCLFSSVHVASGVWEDAGGQAWPGSEGVFRPEQALN